LAKLLAYLLAEKFVFGKKGVDVRFRLIFMEELKKLGITIDTSEGKALFLSIFPLELGNQFPVIAGWLTVVFGLIFIAVAPESIRRIMLQAPRRLFSIVVSG
jgi:hypothetical protein